MKHEYLKKVKVACLPMDRGDEIATHVAQLKVQYDMICDKISMMDEVTKARAFRTMAEIRDKLNEYGYKGAERMLVSWVNHREAITSVVNEYLRDKTMSQRQAMNKIAYMTGTMPSVETFKTWLKKHKRAHQ